MAEPPCCPGQRPSGDSARHAWTAVQSASWDVKTGTAAIGANPNSATVRRRAPRGREVPPARGATCSEWGGGGSEAGTQAGTWRSPRRGRLAARHSVAHAARSRAVRARAWARAKPQVAPSSQLQLGAACKILIGPMTGAVISTLFKKNRRAKLRLRKRSLARLFYKWLIEARLFSYYKWLIEEATPT